MNKNTQPLALLGWMDSLADMVRLRMLRLLEQQELGVTELCEVLQMPQSTVSRHLKVLTDQNWLVNRREGTANLYRMTLEELDLTARKLWQLARQQTQDWPAIQHDQLRLQRVLSARTDKDPGTFFDTAADQWDHLRHEYYGGIFQQTALLSLLPSNMVVADLGCGTGALTAQLAPHVGQVIGVDQSPAMLKAARRRTQGLSNVQLRRGDLENLPIPDAHCDAALLVLVLTYVQNPAQVLAQAARIIKPGGRLTAIDLLEHDRQDFRRHMGQRWPGLPTDKLQAWMADAGWRDIQVRPLPPEPQAKGPALWLACGVRA